MGSGLGESLVDEEGPPRDRPGPAATDGLEFVGSGGAGSSFVVSAALAVLVGVLAVFDFAPGRDAQETRVRPTTKATRRESVLRMMVRTRPDGRPNRNEIPSRPRRPDASHFWRRSGQRTASPLTPTLSPLRGEGVTADALGGWFDWPRRLRTRL